jgi:arsenate reductase
MSEAKVVVYAKDTCTTCRELFELLRDKGIDHSTVEYHVTGLTEAEIRDLLLKLKATPRDVLRQREPLVAELGLEDPQRISDDELITLMTKHPQLLQRPIVIRGDRGVLARPVDRVLELFE